jgi:hypothetical protein
MGKIQKNALKSWTLLRPRCEILLVGNEEGVAEAAKEAGALHFPDVECNAYGTPLVSDAMAIAEKEASNDLLCFISTDDILMGDMMDTIENVKVSGRGFLLCGRRWEGIDAPEGFPGGWEEGLKRHVKAHGRLSGPSAIDYILFPKGFFGHVPPFAIGRSRYDNWWIYKARIMGKPIIDITETVTVVHQNHGHEHILNGKSDIWEGPIKQANTWEGSEAEANKELYGKNRPCYSIDDADYVMTGKGIRRALHSDAIIHDLQRLLRLH